MDRAGYFITHKEDKTMGSKLKPVTVYVTQEETDALHHIKEKSFLEGRTISISGMLREVVLDRINKEKQRDSVIKMLLDGAYDEV